MENYADLSNMYSLKKHCRFHFPKCFSEFGRLYFVKLSDLILFFSIFSIFSIFCFFAGHCITSLGFFPIVFGYLIDGQVNAKTSVS